MERLIGVFFIPPPLSSVKCNRKWRWEFFPCFGLLITGDHATISFWLFVWPCDPQEPPLEVAAHFSIVWPLVTGVAHSLTLTKSFSSFFRRLRNRLLVEPIGRSQIEMMRMTAGRMSIVSGRSVHLSNTFIINQPRSDRNFRFCFVCRLKWFGRAER